MAWHAADAAFSRYSERKGGDERNEEAGGAENI